MDRKNPLKTVTSTPITGYISFNEKNKEEVLKNYNSVIDKFDGIIKRKVVTAAIGDNAVTRAPFNPADFYYQRPLDIVPSKFKDVIHACRGAYLRVGVVRNVIDLMTDFACEDLKFIHTDKKVEAFIKVWMAKVNLREAINEFVRHFLIDSNLVIKRVTAKLTKPVETQWMSKVMAEADEKLYTEHKNLEKREIPWRYIFLNITALEWIGDDVEKLTGQKKLGFRISKNLATSIRNRKDPFQHQLVDRLPKNVRDTIVTKRSDLVPLDMDRIYICHNKKDSWEDWAPPFLYSILSELHYKDKLRQAEISALDGVINVIRLWKLGDHTQKIFPGAAIQRLSDILEANTGGGAIDIIWDSMIDMKDYYPPVEKILGSEKYTQVNKDILIGLGVPEVLIGGAGANFSNSFIQLKTLVEKLNYVRDKLKDWLYHEIHILCDSMDIEVAPKVRFGQMNLEDENVTRRLIVGLLDRGVISSEAVLQAYGQDFLVEIERQRQEKEVYKDIGVKIKGPYDKTDKKGQLERGRPAATRDVKRSRDQRNPKPRRTVSHDLSIKGLNIIDLIDEYAVPIYMKELKIDNARKLTAEHKEDISTLRQTILSCIKPTDKVLSSNILEYAQKTDNINKDVIKCIGESLKDFANKMGELPTLKQKKYIEALAWAKVFGDQNA